MFFEESLAIRQELNDKRGIGASLDNLGQVALRQGHAASARDYFQKSLTMMQQIQDEVGIAIALNHLGRLEFHEQNYPRAAEFHQRALEVAYHLRDRVRSATFLEGLARVRIEQGQTELAVRLLGAAESLRQATGAPLAPVEKEEWERETAGLRAAMSEEAFRALWAEGGAMTLDQVLKVALDRNTVRETAPDNLTGEGRN